jgi:hypothetical protein
VRYRAWTLTNGIYEIAERGRKSALRMSQTGRIIRRLLGEAGKRAAVGDGKRESAGRSESVEQKDHTQQRWQPLGLK